MATQEDIMEAITLFITTGFGGGAQDVQTFTLWGDPYPSRPSPPKTRAKPKTKSKRPQIRNPAERAWLEACWREDREAAAARKLLRQLGSPVIP